MLNKKNDSTISIFNNWNKSNICLQTSISGGEPVFRCKKIDLIKLTRFNNTFNKNKKQLAIQKVVVIILGLVIVITIIGNTLVCLSPIYFRKLRHPSNYLLISLAVSDLGVALLVMPIALFKELHEDWLLGSYYLFLCY